METTTNDKLTWKGMLAEEKQKHYFQDILTQLNEKKHAGKTIYPPAEDVFNAFRLTPYSDIKVVIIGQDPYHGPGQAHGLAFSVKPGVALPPSLSNIFKELHDDLGMNAPRNGCLEAWAKQGVLLLNASLTVEAHQPQSHANLGWQQFTDKVIESLNQHPQGIVFLLWGSYAQKKSDLIDQQKHIILTAPHPSPLSAHRGFFGCKHFSKANEALIRLGRDPIDWAL